MEAREKNRSWRLLFGSVAYQGVWFAAVLSAGASDRWWWGVGSTVLFIGSVLIVWPALRNRVLWMSLAGMLCGLVVDSSMIASGVWAARRMFLPVPLPPLWLLMLWISFGVYIAVGLEMLYGRYRVVTVAGAFGGLLAYRGGAAFGAIEWGSPVWVSTLILMLAWAVVFPALVWIATRLQQQELTAAVQASRMHVALM
jgi:hypothetical protein